MVSAQGIAYGIGSRPGAHSVNDGLETPVAAKDKASKAQKKSQAKAKASALVDRQLIRALGHPLRTHVLAILNERTASPTELADELGEGLSQVAYHVKVLLECDYIELVKTEPRRGAVEHFYRAVGRALLPPDAWDSLPPSIQHGIAMGVFQEIFDDASGALKEGTFQGRSGSHVSWTPLVLDEQAWDGMVELLAETLERAFDLQAEATERMVAQGKEDRDGISVTMALSGFESTRSPEEGRKAQATKR